MRETYCSKAELAELLRLSPRQITRKLRAGTLPPRSKQGYPVIQSVVWYLDGLLDDDPGEYKNPDIEEAALRRWDNRASDIEEAARDR
jgi:hypothetical protein